MKPGPVSIRQVFAIPEVRRLWFGQVVSIFGDFLAVYAVFSLVSFKLKASATEVTMIMISFWLPMALLAPVAGAFVDRWNVKRTMIATDLIRAALACLLLLTSNVWYIYAILLGISATATFFMPAFSVALRLIVAPGALLAANSLMSQAQMIARIVSPAVAGLLVAWLGEQACFYYDVFSFLFSAAMVAGVAIPARSLVPSRGLASVLDDLTASIRFMFTHASISFVMISMATGMFAMACFSALLAVYVRDILSAGSIIFGTLGSMIGIGMVFGTPLIQRLARAHSKPRLVVGGLGVVGVCIFVMALIGSVVGTIVSSFIMGGGIAFILIPSQTLLQEETPVDMLGRVSSSMLSLIGVAQVVALVLAGSAAEWIGIRRLYYASAIMLAAIASIGWLRLKSEISPKPAGEVAPSP